MWVHYNGWKTDKQPTLYSIQFSSLKLTMSPRKPRQNLKIVRFIDSSKCSEPTTTTGPINHSVQLSRLIRVITWLCTWVYRHLWCFPYQYIGLYCIYQPSLYYVTGKFHSRYFYCWLYIMHAVFLIPAWHLPSASPPKSSLCSWIEWERNLMTSRTLWSPTSFEAVITLPVCWLIARHVVSPVGWCYSIDIVHAIELFCRVGLWVVIVMCTAVRG